MLNISALKQAFEHNPAAVESFLSDVETIVGAIERIVETKRSINALAPSTAATPAPSTPAAPIGVESSVSSGAAVAAQTEAVDTSWMKTDAASMENYDAEQLVAMRKALAAGLIEDVSGIVAAVLERRLGSSKP